MIEKQSHQSYYIIGLVISSGREGLCEYVTPRGNQKSLVEKRALIIH